MAAPSVQLSFANNFWGKDDAGVQPLLERMHDAKTTCDELKAFYSARAALEEEYARKMLALSRRPLGSSERGTLRSSLDVMRGEVESMGKAHQAIAGQMKNELEEPLAAFAGGLKERRKIVQTGIEKLFKAKQQQTNAVNKSRDRYEQDCLKIKGYLAQGHMVMGQEERKNKVKMEKTQIQLATTSNEYEAAVKVLEETTLRWNRDWKAACDKFQDLEEERLDFTKGSLWTFANVASTVCVSDDASCEKIRLSLEGCEVEKDISSFIQDNGTGQEIPDAPKFINFCRGDVNDTASEASDDGDYSVAQFPRTINPAFRSSSPQPSATDGSMKSEMNHLNRRFDEDLDITPQPRQRNNNRPVQGGATPPLVDFRAQSQTIAPYQHKVDELPLVPHNEFPENGMTMFCRKDAASERSSVVSPARPSSRDSHSEYSAPTSISSLESPANALQPYTIKDLPEHDEAYDDRSPTQQTQKRRSGFFSNSPFRRKSKHEKDGSSLSISNSRSMYNENEIGRDSTRRSDVQASARSRHNSASPEPIDPRADLQLNVGPNVFDVASSPEKKSAGKGFPNRASPNKELDPIAAALEELKGANKQSSVRISADRYAGVSTPSLASNASDPAAGQRGTPPPSYSDHGSRRLGPPQPAFTSAQMQRTTRDYVNQNQSMYGSGPTQPQQNHRGAPIPRATSPRPMRSVSPRPGYQNSRDGHQRPREQSPEYRQSSGMRRSPQNDRSRPSYHQHHSPDDVGRQSPRPRSSGQQQYDQPDGRNHAMTLAPSQQRSRDQPTGKSRSKTTASRNNLTPQGLPILQYARALFMYRAVIPEELSFAKGEVLAITRYQDDGWWEAEPTTNSKGQSGLVPSNYLEHC